jgi:hypothetical protein
MKLAMFNMLRPPKLNYGVYTVWDNYPVLIIPTVYTHRDKSSWSGTIVTEKLFQCWNGTGVYACVLIITEFHKQIR